LLGRPPTGSLLALPRGVFSVSQAPSSERGPDWWLSSVYGPANNGDKPSFLEELHDLRRVQTGAWMINGDFNLIYHAEDKNNCRLNHRLMGQFRRFLNVAELKEAFLDGQLFTWSSERSHPTLEKIDRVFFTNEWEAIYPQHYLHSLPSLC
jgi:hypothetical protein